MDIELEKLKKLEHALCDVIDILRDWQVEEAKPEEEKWIAYLARQKNGLCYLSACTESYWKDMQKKIGAKTKLFIGAHYEVRKWYEFRQKFSEVIKAWEDGKTIQYLDESTKTWMDIPKDFTIAWFTDREYRIKPEEKTAYVHKGVDGYFIDGFIDGSVYQGTIVECEKWIEGHEKKCPCADALDSKACVGCEHSEDGKPRINKNYAEGACKDCLERKRKRIEERASKFGEVCVHPEYDDEKCKKCNECIEGPDYRPFKDCDELVEFWSKNYQTGFRPANTKPLIWVRLKVDKRERLIVAYGDNFVEIGNKTKAVTLQHLFEQYEFLDGKPCGMEVKE